MMLTAGSYDRAAPSPMPGNPYQPPQEVGQRKPRRRFRFTLRGLLLLALPVLLAADWFRHYLVVSVIFDSTANPGGAAVAAAEMHWPYLVAESLILLIAIPAILTAVLISLLRESRTFF